MMKYADAIGAGHVLIIGEEERASGLYTLRHMAEGIQQKLDLKGIIHALTAPTNC